ncbi:MAG: cytochrome c, partial [Pseudomonadota bacterium]
ESASSIRNAINEESEMRFLSTLSSTDIQDIANYLSGSGSTSPTSGEGLYNSYCAGCHGPTGRGGPAGDVRGASTDKIKSAIREERDMRYLSGMLTDSQIRLISTYLRSFGGGDD